MGRGKPAPTLLHLIFKDHQPTGWLAIIPASRRRRLNSIVADATRKTNYGRHGFNPCHYPNFVTKCVCRILARDSGRQNKAWGGAQRNPRYEVDLSLKPAKRAAAIGPISMMMK